MTIIKRRLDHFYILSSGISRYHTMLDHVMNRGPACHWAKHQTAQCMDALYTAGTYDKTRPLNVWMPCTPQELMTRHDRSMYGCRVRRRNLWQGTTAQCMDALYVAGSYDKTHDSSMYGCPVRCRILWQDTRQLNVWMRCTPQDLMTRHTTTECMDALCAAGSYDRTHDRSCMDALYAAGS